MKNLIKYLLIFTAVALPIVLSSCSEDDESSPLIGKWILLENENGHTDSSVLEFNANGTGILTYTCPAENPATEVSAFAYTLSGDVTKGATMSIIFMGDDEPSYYSVIVHDNTLTMTRNEYIPGYGYETSVLTRM